MIYYALFAAGWLACSIATWLLIRRRKCLGLLFDSRRPSWTIERQIIGLLVSGYGPFGLLLILILTFLDRLFGDHDRPARW